LTYLYYSSSQERVTCNWSEKIPIENFSRQFFVSLSECWQDATLSLRRPRDAPNIWVPWTLCVD